MATGDKVLASRVRAESNERLDLVDWSQMAVTAQVFLEAAVRALFSTPKATAGTPTGERWTGSITANPTSGSDGLIRVDSAVFVGLDANGGLVLKPNGTALSASVPSGGSAQQVYLYMSDSAQNTQVRRKLPATGPFNEFSAAINVALLQQANIYIRAGSSGSVVAQDSIGGSTYALLFLGIATNTGGAVTFTPAANMLETVTQPASYPTANTGTTSGSNTVTGSQSTLRELVNAALYQLGQTMWKGSAFLTPSAANNYGAYSTPAGGVDKAFRNAMGYVTIGNGTTVIGDFNTSDYANANAMLTAAIAALPTEGGRIILKPGISLSGFNSATIAMPASKTVEIVGDHKNVPTTTPHLTFAAGEGLVCSATGMLVLRNLHIQHAATGITLTTSPCVVKECYFENTAATDAGAALQGTNVTDLDVQDTRFYTNFTSDSSNADCIRITGTAYRIRTRGIYHEIHGLHCRSISIADMRANVRLYDTTLDWTYVGSATTISTACIYLATTDNTSVAEIGGRHVEGIFLNTGASFAAIDFTNVGYLTIKDLKVPSGRRGLLSSTGGWVGPVRVLNGEFTNSGISQASVETVAGGDTIYFESCHFGKTVTIGDGSSALTDVQFTNCKFDAINNIVAGSTIAKCCIDNCWFDGQSNASSNDFALFRIEGATSIDLAMYTDNVVTNIQNVAYTGDTTTLGRAFEVDTPVATRVVCSGNQMRKVMDTLGGSSGNLRYGIYLLDCSTYDRATDNAGNYWGSIEVKNNHIGGNTSCVSILNSTHIWAARIIINDNNVTTRWHSTTAKFNDLIRIVTPNIGGSEIDILRVDGNTVYVNNGSVTDVQQSFFNFSDAGGTLSMYVCSFQDNLLFMSNDANVWSGNGAAVAFTGVGTLVNLTVVNNTASRQGTDSTAWFHTSLPGTVTRSVPSVPGAGAAWTSNNMWHN